MRDGGLRLFLDLRACQSAGGGGERGAQALALARELIAAGDGHEVHLALDGGLPARIPELKAAFPDLAPERFAVYGLPWDPASPAAADPWYRHTAAALRWAFFAWRGASVVIESDWTAWPEGCGVASLPQAALTPVVRAATIWPGDPHPGTSVDVCLPPDPSTAGAAAAVAAFGAAVARRRSVHHLSAARPRLAVVSPLPPSASPTAGEAAAVLPALARHYRVDVVAEQEAFSDRWVSEHVAVRSPGWFASNAVRYDRILYFVADDPANAFVVPLLERHPGAVVLRDTRLPLLSGVPGDASRPEGLAADLYDWYGYSALVALRRGGPEGVAEAFPCSAGVVRSAAGLVVGASGDAEDLVGWYGAGLGDDVRVVPPPGSGQDPGAEAVGDSLRRALETFSSSSGQAVYRRLLRDVSAAPPSPAAPGDVLELARAVSAARPRLGARQLLVDISELAVSDFRTGVQRVSRAVLKNLLEDPPCGHRVEPVRGTPRGHRYARRYAQALLELPGQDLDEAPLDPRPGDRFLSVDLSYEMLRHCRGELVRLRDRGVRLDFVVYDMLPVLHPEWFPGEVPRQHLEWLRTAALIADGLVCISATVADELREWLRRERPERATPLDVGYFGLGADLAASAPSIGAGRDRLEAEAFVAARPAFLMVGTVEPRKGHAQALAAFEQLWESGVDCSLLIIGKEGWNVGDLASRLRVHPERGRRLLWLDAASDEVLEAVYPKAAALLAPSEGEGFGLPLVEAAQYGVPIVARDLPVFEEVAGAHAFYFHGRLPEDLAAGVREWLALRDRGEAPESRGMPWLTWAESTGQLVACVLEDGWQARWSPAASA